jgi:hypothetical protein
LSITYVFIKQIFRAVQLAPPPFPLPLTGLCRGWGSSGSFQPQAVALVMAMKQLGLGLNIFSAFHFTRLWKKIFILKEICHDKICCIAVFGCFQILLAGEKSILLVATKKKSHWDTKCVVVEF